MDKLEISAVLDELEEYIQAASRVPLVSKVVVDGDHVLEMIDRIHALLPEEMRQAKQVLDQSDKLLESIEDQGKRILEDAKVQSARMVSESEVVKAAQAQAQEIIAEANREAQSIREQSQQAAVEVTEGAKSYVESVLVQLEKNLDAVTASVKDTRINWQKSIS